MVSVLDAKYPKEEKIEDHREKYYSECPRCCEIKGRNQAIKELFDNLHK